MFWREDMNYLCINFISNMQRLSIDELKKEMNKNGANGIPFLFIVDFDLKEGIFIENPIEEKEILFHCPLGNNIPHENKIDKGRGGLSFYPVSFEEYQQKFEIVMAGLKRGDSFLTNLTIKTPIESPYTLEQIFHLSNSPYRLYVPDMFVCFSPERFVKIVDGMISTNPMKGTISADVENAENMILSDEKETAEHYTIVDLLRNDLGIVANNIRVERFRYIDYIQTNKQDILQVSSEITGRLEHDYCARLGDIIFQMLPAGSVSGAPKESTVNIIRKSENESRGYYTGVFGYFDGEQFDSAVLIRYIEEVDGQKYFRSGGGITVYSDPKKEYNEILEKIYLPFI